MKVVHLLLESSLLHLALGSLSGFQSLEVSFNANGAPTKSCFFVSFDKVWPHPGNALLESSQAELVCNSVGLTLGEVSNDEEALALQEFTRCKMGIGRKETLLIKSGGITGSDNACVFQNYDGTFQGSDDQNCIQEFADESEDHQQSYFICKKDAACNEIPGCNKVFNSICEITVENSHGTFPEALETCQNAGGYLPRLTNIAEVETINELRSNGEGSYNNRWTSLTSDTETPIKACDTFVDCIIKGDKWYWPEVNEHKLARALLNSAIEPLVSINIKDDAEPCVLFDKSSILRTEKCDVRYRFACYRDASLDLLATMEPEFVSGTFTCPLPVPSVPSGVTFQPVPDEDQPILMCPGSKAKYECNIGILNIREDNNAKSTFEIPCKSNQEYDEPASIADWPVCIDRLDCPQPDYDKYILETSNWNLGDSLTPPFTIDFQCIRPGKKVLPRSDLINQINENMVDVLTVTCFYNGTFDVNPDDYACTNPCQPPDIPKGELMEHDWPDPDLNLEIEQQVLFKCQNNRKLVKKAHFERGQTDTFLDSLMASCQVDGAINSTLHTYTCTKPCQEPVYRNDTFTYDWDESMGSEIGTEINYVCLDPTKQIANIKGETSEVYQVLKTTCLFNGKYDFNVHDWNCTDCLKRPDPPNGHLKCQSFKFEAGSSCVLQCDAGYIPLGKTVMTCTFDKNINDYDWTIEADQFLCIEPIGLLIGGQAADYSYLDQVEVFAPGFDCQYQPPLVPYPRRIIGASAGFIEGQNIVCGGAVYEYFDCKLHSEGSNICNRNVDCVQTKGGSQWCTGPKIKTCYSYDFLNFNWTKSLDLKSPRAYASSVSMLDGSFWIFGGVGTKSILKSSEVLELRKSGAWKLRSGPNLPQAMMGHCAAALDPWHIIIAGGFNPNTADYIEKAYILDLTNSNGDSFWITKPWYKLNYGPVLDSSCGLFHWEGKHQVVISGGWNNSALHSTEIFDADSRRWDEMGKTYNSSHFIMALPYGLRSAVMGELDKKPFLAGGVKCEGQYGKKQSCQRSEEVLMLTKNNQGTFWHPMNQLKLSQPKSSATLLLVPRIYAKFCQLLP